MNENLKRHRPDIKVLGEGRAIAFMPEAPMGVWVHIQEVRDLLDVKDKEIAEYQEKIIALEKSYKKLIKKFVHETSVAESYRSLIYKEDALKYQEAGNSEMYDELSKKSDKAYRHANRWRRIFRKMSQE